MKINFLLILLTVFSFNLISKDLSGIKASRTILSMDSGEMEFLITKKEDNLWEMRSFVDGGRVFEREEISIFKLSKENLIPLNHKLRSRYLFIKIKSSRNPLAYALPVWTLPSSDIFNENIQKKKRFGVLFFEIRREAPIFF